MNNLKRSTITSMEVAEMVGKKHCDLLRDIRKYVDQLGESKIAFTDFFKEATYTTEQNKILPCFQVTKKGCEFIAHKLTGQKGTEFTARYIKRFHEMEDGKLPCPLNPIIASSVAELGRVTDRIMTKQGSAPYKIAEACSNLADARACARRTYNAAVELFAYLCKEYGLNPMKDGVILSHAEGSARGIATNHGDLEHLWRGLALPYTMNTFRKAVKLKMEGKTGTVQELAKADTDQKANTQKPTTKKFYRVRKSWGDAASQLGAFESLELAKKRADQSKGYKVYDSNGKQVYPKTETASDAKKKSVTTLAKEVIAGKWGVGEDRKKRLTAAGYDHAAIQKKVNEMLK